MAAEPRSPLVVRFSATERIAHLIHAAAFFALLFTGLVLYLPALSGTLGSRETVKAIHLWTAAGWAVALVAVALIGNWSALKRSWQQTERFDAADRAWLRKRSGPAGRFNAGQKIHTVIQAEFGVLFVISGLLLWFGEQNTNLRFGGTIVLHDGLTLMATVLVLGHLYLALLAPKTRHSMRGIVLGTVRQDWAAEHHSEWRPAKPPS